MNKNKVEVDQIWTLYKKGSSDIELTMRIVTLPHSLNDRLIGEITKSNSSDQPIGTFWASILYPFPRLDKSRCYAYLKTRGWSLQSEIADSPPASGKVRFSPPASGKVRLGQIWKWTRGYNSHKMWITGADPSTGITGLVFESTNACGAPDKNVPYGYSSRRTFDSEFIPSDHLIKFHWTLEKEAPPEGFDGYTCVGCYHDFWYVAANQPDGTFKCSSCLNKRPL